MYNLLITSSANAWEGTSGRYEFSVDRFLEYTDPDLRTELRQLDAKTIDLLCSLPALFAYEDDVGNPARVGRITGIERGDSQIVLAFRIDPDARSITSEELSELQGEMGITDSFELHRTHWAVKNVDLPRLILRGGRLAELVGDLRRAALHDDEWIAFGIVEVQEEQRKVVDIAGGGRGLDAQGQNIVGRGAQLALVKGDRCQARGLLLVVDLGTTPQY